MVNVLCVKFGTKYGRDYVEKLHNMVSRHLTIPYEFYCLTDDKHSIEGVTNIHLSNQNYVKQWWHKVHMFDPNLGLKGRILYFDLDVIIHNNIDKLIDLKTENFYGIRDFNRKFHPNWNILNSSAMSWISGQHQDIFRDFKANSKEALRLHGDQDWIWRRAKERIKFWPDPWLMSYKWEIRNKRDIDLTKMPRKFRTIANPPIPNECSVCVFHGDPNPHDIEDPYVLDNWK